MSLNVDKCKVLNIARNKKFTDYKYNFNTINSGVVALERVDSMKDLGVIVDSELSFKNHVHEKINKAYQMIGIINRNFKDLDTYSLVLLYKCMVRSHLEYANSVWNPYRVSLIEDIEKVQKRATKLVKGLKKLTYKERLQRLNLPTLKYRRLRGDMIEVYKIVSGKYDYEICPNLPVSENLRTRGNSYKLKTNRTKYDIRRYSFTNRIVSSWNTLPDEVVCADSVNSFKNRLDKHWMNQDIYYDYKAELTGS